MREALSALTTRGRAFLAAGFTITLCAVVLGFDALLRVGILAVSLPLLAAFVVGRARYRLSARRAVYPQRVAPGQPATVTLAMANEGVMPMSLLLLEDRVPYALGTRARFMLDRVGPRWRQQVSYPVRSEIRGRFEIGPLSIRVSDPFGFIELIRYFRETNDVVVVPVVHALSPISLESAWTGQGENRPRAFAVGSAEDVMTREYRRGDDLRRVHWRSTARVGELMVRREEQPWQSRATIVLDSRRIAHRGTGAASSLEWLVQAAASIAVHLSQAGYSVRLVTDRPDPEANAWHDRLADPQAQAGPILDELAVMSVSEHQSLNHAVDAVAGSAGLVIGLFGSLQSGDVADLARMRAHGSTVLAMILDTIAWDGDTDGDTSTATRMVGALGLHGWHAVVADPYETPAVTWMRIGALAGRGARAGRSA